MAFYAYNAARQAVQTIGSNDRLRSDGVGAYYAYDATHEAVQPVNGVALGASGTLTDEVMRDLVGARRPLLVVGPWARHVTDAVWQPLGTAKFEYTLVPITQSDLTRVKQNSGGHDVPMIGIVSARSAKTADLESAFVGTPYAFAQEIAAYSVDDKRAIPTPVFLTTARLRDAMDQDGGSSPVSVAAQALRGTLVYQIALPAQSQRRLPSIEAALIRMPAAPKSMPHLGAPPPPLTPDRVERSRARARGGFRQRGMLGEVSTPVVALGVGAALIAGVVVFSAAVGGKR